MATNAKDKKAKPKPYAPGKSCPKCGAGSRLGNHKNRLACGKCGYTEMKTAEKK